MKRLWCSEDGQDIAEYAVLIAIVFTIAIGLVLWIGGQADQVLSEIGSKLQ
jgi:Flp pilus assembly pilin Flp